MDINANDVYKVVFREYPDVMDVGQVSKLLGVSTKTVYGLIRGGALPCMKAGREYRIAKVSVMRYLKIYGDAGGLSPKS